MNKYVLTKSELNRYIFVFVLGIRSRWPWMRAQSADHAIFNEQIVLLNVQATPTAHHTAHKHTTIYDSGLISRQRVWHFHRTQRISFAYDSRGMPTADFKRRPSLPSAAVKCPVDI